MVLHDHAWSGACREHAQVLTEFLAMIDRMPPDRWQRPPRPNKWSAATLTEHLSVTYAYGRDAATTGRGMRLLVPRPIAWAARTFILPRMLASQKFARGAKAPAEVRPDVGESAALTQAEAKMRLTERADESLAAFDRAMRERPELRITHAYFGPLSLLLTLRMLSAHTRHHSGGMAWRLTAR